jgi:hypothetical protein
MNRYQKIFVCVFRSIGIVLLGYASVALITASLMMRGILGMALVGSLPILAAGLVCYLAAVPLARIITIGIDE